MTTQEYLKSIKLTEDEYKIFTHTWIGMEKLKGILKGTVDGGTVLGHALGNMYSLQGCILSMLTNEHNVKYKKEHDSKSDKGQLPQG